MTGPGRRKDGRPYRDGNVDENGNYVVGKNRTPEATRFAVGDGRKRGTRKKGSRNFETDWEEELTKKVRVVRNGKAQKVSAHHAQVMRTLELASKGKERSQELVFRQAEKLQERRRRHSTKSDDQLIADWLAQQGDGSTGLKIAGDDQLAHPADSEAEDISDEDMSPPLSIDENGSDDDQQR